MQPDCKARNETRVRCGLALLLACLALPAPAPAQSDTRPLRVLVGTPPGGVADVVTRILSEGVRELLGRPIVIENRPGYGGQVAAVLLKHAAPDGGTVMLSIDHTHVTIPLTFREPGYDPLRDFTPIVGVAQYYNAMAAGAKTDIRNLRDMAAWMRAHPGEHNFGIPARGSIPQFAGLLVGKALHVDMEPIPYKGGAPLVQGLIGGQVPIGFGALTELIEHHRAGRLRVLAVSGTRRARAAPGIPTFQELGLKGIDRNPWLAFFGPAGLHPDFVAKLSSAVRLAMDTPEARERFAALGIEAAPTQPEGLRDWVEDAMKHWGPVIRDSGYVLQ
jgi:tripartite-type tricarboxylate transporter receptor subunit TctC